MTREPKIRVTKGEQVIALANAIEGQTEGHPRTRTNQREPIAPGKGFRLAFPKETSTPDKVDEGSQPAAVPPRARYTWCREMAILALRLRPTGPTSLRGPDDERRCRRDFPRE